MPRRFIDGEGMSVSITQIKDGSFAVEIVAKDPSEWVPGGSSGVRSLRISLKDCGSLGFMLNKAWTEWRGLLNDERMPQE